MLRDISRHIVYDLLWNQLRPHHSHVRMIVAVSNSLTQLQPAVHTRDLLSKVLKW